MPLVTPVVNQRESVQAEAIESVYSQAETVNEVASLPFEPNPGPSAEVYAREESGEIVAITQVDLSIQAPKVDQGELPVVIESNEPVIQEPELVPVRNDEFFPEASAQNSKNEIPVMEPSVPKLELDPKPPVHELYIQGAHLPTHGSWIEAYKPEVIDEAAALEFYAEAALVLDENDNDTMQDAYEPDQPGSAMIATETITGIEQDQISYEPTSNQSDVTDIERTETTAKTFTSFESFIVAQPPNLEPLKIEALEEGIDERPMAETLVQLVEYVEEPAEGQIDAAIAQAISEIEELLPDCYEENEKGEIVMRITPEISEKVLNLLSTLGCDRPAETFARFADDYEDSFLVEALECICRLNNQDRDELLLSSFASDDSDGNGRLRLGRLIGGLTIRLTTQ